MVDIGIKKPTAAIVESGDPKGHTMIVETATNMYPGRLVENGTTDADCVVCTAKDKPIGVLGYHQTSAPYKPATVDTIYVILDQAFVITKLDGNFVGSLVATTTCTKGDYLYPAASGEVTTLELYCTVPVGKAMESLTYNAASQDVLIESML